jgi:hypothetical protein
MGNDDEYDELAPVRRCGYCKTPMLDQRKGAIYCDRRCKELAAKKRRTSRARVDALREKYPVADLSLEELYARAAPPRHVNGDQGDEAGHLDDDGYPHEDQGDEAASGPGAWSDIWRLQEAIERANRRYERRMQPYLVQMKRNPGVRPVGLVALERQRDDEIARMVRAHDHASQLSRARLNEAKRINEAHERQRERDALRALAQDLPGGSRRYEAPHAGRATGDIWRW